MKKWNIAGVIFCSVVWLGGCGTTTGTLISASSMKLEQELQEDTAQISQKEEKKSSFCVYVCGQVCQPGVYQMETGMRVCDAISAAGGMTESASLSYWNLAQLLEDEMMIYVPTQEEIDSGSLPQAHVTQNSAVSGETVSGLININTATKEELTKLPGIGDTRADRIITYRQLHGEFGTKTDLMNVSGIKDAIYRELEDYITVE